MRFACSFAAVVFVACSANADTQLRVMTFNLWHGGDAGGQPLAQSVKAIQVADADIVGLQETHGKEVDGVRPDNGKKIADELGWEYLQQGDRTGIASRFPIKSASLRKWGVEIEYKPDKSLFFFNAHFAAAPYQPYQLLKISYGNGKFITTESEAIIEANFARGDSVTSLLGEMKNAITGRSPVFLTGDFNEPSHQDWTARAAKAGLCPLKVSYPTTSRIAKAGLIDTWRKTHPHEVQQPGRTWTNTTSIDDPKDRHDRIDYVFAAKVRILSCQVVGEKKSVADLTLNPWPSDHRAVVAEVLIKD